MPIVKIITLYIVNASSRARSDTLYIVYTVSRAQSNASRTLARNKKIKIPILRNLDHTVVYNMTRECARTQFIIINYGRIEKKKKNTKVTPYLSKCQLHTPRQREKCDDNIFCPLLSCRSSRRTDRSRFLSITANTTLMLY